MIKFIFFAITYFIEQQSVICFFGQVSQEVILDKNIRLIDSPGIVFADGDSAATALRNCVNVEEMEDVLTPVQAILDRCPQGYLFRSVEMIILS